MQTPFGDEYDQWPPDYRAIFQWRQSKILEFRANPALLVGARQYYKTRAVEFIVHWVDTYDPRNAGRGLTSMPFVLFRRQRELITFMQECLEDEASGLIEKARDMGATWAACAFSVWLWLFWKGSATGWGSRKEQLVDKLGDPDSIFEKMRMLIQGLPREFWPAGFDPREHLSYMRIVNPENGATITGEVGDNIGRGGRKLIYFKDESAHYPRPQLIEAALGDNTRVQMDISSVNGTGNVFHNRREAGIDWQPGCQIERGRTRVFVLDWRDHPDKTQAWYDERKAKADMDGLAHIFAQEVDRDYASAVEGVIIPAEYVRAAVDAHIALGFEPEGPSSYGLDVADEGGDTNALIGRRGSVANFAAEWGGIDVGATTRKAIDLINGRPSFGSPIGIDYDAIGVGSAVKAEVNRLVEDELITVDKLLFVPWIASAKVLHPKRRIVEGNKDAPRNEDFFYNFKAQAWWNTRRRFENTWRAIHDSRLRFPVDQLISLDSEMPHLAKLMKELSQPVRKSSPNLKMMVDKKPEGSKSPNLGDGFVQAFYPARRKYRQGLW